MAYIILRGDIVSGFQAYGPFSKSYFDVVKWAREEFHPVPFVVMQLRADIAGITDNPTVDPSEAIA